MSLLVLAKILSFRLALIKYHERKLKKENGKIQSLFTALDAALCGFVLSLDKRVRYLIFRHDVARTWHSVNLSSEIEEFKIQVIL